MKKSYIIPSIFILKINVEKMVAESKPEVSNKSFNKNQSIDVKANTTNHYDVWDDDWSK